MNSNQKQAITLGLAASLFFSVTFVVNRLMSVEGGSWVWSSSFRFYWMVLFFIAIVGCQGGLKQLFDEIKKDIGSWLLWSTVGFGVFYAPLTYASAFTPSWLLAGTWQFTIIAGILLAPFLSPKKTGPHSGLFSSAAFSLIILLGIIILQASNAADMPSESILKGVVPVLVAAFAYPLGNRKMMQITGGRLTAYQRILGMTICSLPFWLLINFYGVYVEESSPSNGQIIQTLMIALFSGVFATTLFFKATDYVSENQKQLAAVEATQSTEVLFALAGEVMLLNSALPNMIGVAGIVMVMLGMILHSVKS